MVPANNREDAWYRQLGARAVAACGGGKEFADGATSKIGDSLDELTDWHCYDLADVMEQGLSRALMSSYTGTHATERRLLVRRSRDRREYTLTTEDGDEILMARAAAMPGFDIFIPSGGAVPWSSRPAFRVREAAGQWTMQSLRCDRCESLGRRQRSTPHLLRAFHYKEEMGKERAHCMDVVLAGGHLSGGWCGNCGDQCSESIEFTSRRPTWNKKIKSLCLDFHGRVSMASSKNIILDPSGGAGEGEAFTLMLGKTGDDLFALHFQEPFGTAQAFGTALSAMYFK